MNDEMNAQLEGERARQEQLRAEVVEAENALVETKQRMSEASSRGAFEKCEADVKWATHLIELAKQRVEQHQTEVLSPIEGRCAQAEADRQTSAVSAARADAEEAFATANREVLAAVKSLQQALESLRTFDRARLANPRGVASVNSVKLDALLPAIDKSLKQIAADSHIAYIHTGDPGLLELRVGLPAAVPAVLR
jgi:hypothetical protein